MGEGFSPGAGAAFDSSHSIVDFFAAKHGENTVSVQHMDSDYWRGVIEGARKVYEAVRALLRGRGRYVQSIPTPSVPFPGRHPPVRPRTGRDLVTPL